MGAGSSGGQICGGGRRAVGLCPMGLDLGLKGFEGLAGLSVWQVLRLRLAKCARPSLRMTNLGWG